MKVVERGVVMGVGSGDDEISRGDCGGEQGIGRGGMMAIGGEDDGIGGGYGRMVMK